MKLAGGINAYLYAPNPTGWVDPLGLSTCPGNNECKPSSSVDEPVPQHNDGQPTLPTAHSHFPRDPNDLTEVLGVTPKVSTTKHDTQRMEWRPNSNTRIRFESHPGDEGIFVPRHHGEHYHIELKPNDFSWRQAEKNNLVMKVLPHNYKKGHGSGFLPGEKHPGS